MECHWYDSIWVSIIGLWFIEYIVGSDKFTPWLKVGSVPGFIIVLLRDVLVRRRGMGVLVKKDNPINNLATTLKIGALSMALEGKELEGKIGDVGEYYVDVDVKGMVEFYLGFNKTFEGGGASSENKVNVQLLAILEAYTKKTGATWDDNVVKGIKALLGMMS